ncbi:Tim17 domain-containing protein [Ceratobasidium sp. AG-Ba]|nr:Tim17 domain-containing protein [Ceratobasidium sp. AG-Ba]QRW02998.1 Tim17 domain-containing protein [Ceratobasidium sp. AG-Ba]
MSFSGATGSSSANSSSGTRDDAAAYLRSASFSRNEGSTPGTAVTASDLLNAASFDPSRLHPMAGLGDKLDYLALDDEKTNSLPGAGTALPSRGWSDDLCYGTGTTYLSGVLESLACSSRGHIIGH